MLPIHRQIWELGHSTHICGILNVTPDSFSDGGRFVAAGAQQEAQGAAAQSGTAAAAAAAAGQPSRHRRQQLQHTTAASMQQEQPAAGAAAGSPRAVSSNSSSSSSDAASPGASSSSTTQATSTPASVTDRGAPFDVEAAVEAARAMSRAGAALIDVGGQSTRPGSQRISAEQELARVLPVIRCVVKWCLG